MLTPTICPPPPSQATYDDGHPPSCCLQTFYPLPSQATYDDGTPFKYQATVKNVNGVLT